MDSSEERRKGRPDCWPRLDYLKPADLILAFICIYVPNNFMRLGTNCMGPLVSLNKVRRYECHFPGVSRGGIDEIEASSEYL